jgi:hypothetical protein
MDDQRANRASGVNLTPQQKTYLKRVLHLQNTGGIVRRRTIVHRVAVGFAMLFFAISVIGIVNEWGGLAISATSFLVGLCVGLAGYTKGNMDLWPAWEAVIDWDRLSALANSEEKSNPTN